MKQRLFTLILLLNCLTEAPSFAMSCAGGLLRKADNLSASTPNEYLSKIATYLKEAYRLPLPASGNTAMVASPYYIIINNIGTKVDWLESSVAMADFVVRLRVNSRHVELLKAMADALDPREPNLSRAGLVVASLDFLNSVSGGNTPTRLSQGAIINALTISDDEFTAAVATLVEIQGATSDHSLQTLGVQSERYFNRLRGYFHRKWFQNAVFYAADVLAAFNPEPVQNFLRIVQTYGTPEETQIRTLVRQNIAWSGYTDDNPSNERHRQQALRSNTLRLRQILAHAP